MTYSKASMKQIGIKRVLIKLLIVFFTIVNKKWEVLCEYNERLLKNDEWEVDYIFNPYPLLQYTIHNPQATSNKILHVPSINALFTSWGNAGLAIFNTLTNKQEYFFASDTFIRGIAATKDGRFIFFMHLNRLTSFEYLRSEKGSKLIEKSVSNQTNNVIFEIILSNDEQIAIALTNNYEINIFDVRLKSFENQIFPLLNQISASSQIIYNGQLTQNEKYLLVANDSSGLSIYNFEKTAQENELKINISLNSIIPIDWQAVDIVLTYDETYIYGADCWSGIFIVNTNKNNPVKELQWKGELKMKNFWPDMSSTIPFCLQVTLDDHFLLVASRLQGVFVLDITQKENPVLFQKISIGGHSFSMQLANNDSKLFYSNGETIYLFEKVLPNLNNDFPNLENSHIQKLHQIGDYQYRWRCYVDSSDKYFFGAFDKGGLFVYSLKNNILDSQPNPFTMKPVNHLEFSELTCIDVVLFYEKADLIFLAVSQTKHKMFVYKLSEVIKQDNFNVQPLFKLGYENSDTISESIISNNEQTIIGITSGNGFLIINTRNLSSITTMSTFTLPSSIVGNINSGLFSIDSRYVILTIRNFGFISVNIEDCYKPFLVDQLETLGGETILNKITDQNYAYASDGYKGLIIIDLNYLPKIHILTRLQTDGWLNHIQPFQLSQYLILSHLDQGYISLVNVQDKQKPETISKLAFRNQNAMSSCKTQNGKYLFITNSVGVNIIPLQSTVLIHTQILQVLGKENGNISYILQEKNNKLKIGQIFLFQFIALYPSGDLTLSKVQYYNQDYQIKDPPFWINPDLSKSQVEINVVKEGLGVDVSQENLNTIILVYKKTISIESFIFQDIGDKVVTDRSQGEVIFKYLQDIDLISPHSYTSDKFDLQQTINFSGLNLGGMQIEENFKDRVRLTLLSSIQKNPISFYICPSLSFDIAKGEIHSLTNNVSLYLSADQDKAKFISITYNGILTSFTDQGSSIKLEGTSTSLNTLFQTQKIIYFMKSSDISLVSVKFTLQDNTNYDVSKIYSIQELDKILRQKQPVCMNPNSKNLQDQFDRIYYDSEVPVEQNVSFEFSESTFMSPDGLSLIYKVLYDEGDGEYSNTVSHQWLQQSSNSLKFYGIPPISLYRTRINVKVIASDGCDEFSDTFVILIYAIPFSYLINLLFKILSPIAAIIGLYSYRSFFFNAIFKEKNLYGPELCIINSFFCKKITILGDENKKAIYLFNSMKRHMNLAQSSGRRNHKSGSKRNSLFIYGVSINSQDNIAIEDDPLSKQIGQQLCKNQKQSTYLDEIHIQNNNNGLSSPIISNRRKTNSENIGSEFSNQNLQQQSGCLIDSPVSFEQINKKLQRAHHYTEMRKEQLIFLNKLNQMKNQKSQTNAIIKQFIRQDGSIRISKIIQYMIQENLSFTYYNETFTAKSLAKDLKDEKSRLYKSLRAVVSRYFLQYDEKTDLFFDFLRDEALSQYNCNEKDWYKLYTEINSSPSIVNEQLETISFPTVLIKKDMIRQTFINLRLLKLQEEMEKIIERNKINLSLIYEVLTAEALGLLDYVPNTFSKSQGESIHLNFFEISQIEAFKPIKHINCTFLRKTMNMTLADYGASQNMKLPNWIKFDQKSSCIILQGVPTSSDIEDITIRIFDKKGYIIREFPLSIVDENKEIPVEFDEESAQLSARRERINEQLGQQNTFTQRNYAISETMLSPIIQNSTSNQTKPSLFSNNPYTPIQSTFRSFKNLSSRNKNELISNQTVDSQSSNRNQRAMSNEGKQIEEIQSGEDDENITDKKTQSEKKSIILIDEKLQNGECESKVQDSINQSSQSQSNSHFKYKQRQQSELSKEIKSIGDENASSINTSNLSPIKIKSSFVQQHYPNQSREREELGIELSSQPISSPNQFHQYIVRDIYFNQSN